MFVMDMLILFCVRILLVFQEEEKAKWYACEEVSYTALCDCVYL